ncbi:hypothetical protein ABM074_00170 [Morganella morganii]|uniref:hypothetical protein n=1 Tax=Morganella morganii TaxID=582 RepID=UPI00331CF5DD
MEPTDFEKWCAKDMGIPLNRIMRWKFGDGYTEGDIDARYRAWNAGVRSRLPYQTPPKGDEDEMD